MATTDKNTIYSWFQTDDFPTEEQFRATWDSFWHKSESIPMSQITGLNQLFQQTATVAQLNDKANVDGSNIDVSAYQEKLNITNLIATAKEEVKTELLNGAPEAFDTLKEISDWISDDETAEGAILQAIQTEAAARTNADNLKLDKPTTTSNTTSYPYVVGEDGNGNSARLPAGDLGKNFFNADLSNTTARTHTMNAGVTVNTLGNPHTLSGLPNKNADITNFRKVRVQNTSGLDAVVDSKSMLLDMPSYLTEQERTNWKTAMNGGWTTNTMSVGLISPLVIPYSVDQLYYITLQGANLNINPASFTIEIMDSTGTISIDTINNNQVNLINQTSLNFYYNFKNLPIADYKIRIWNGVASYITGLFFKILDLTNIEVINPSSLSWAIIKDPTDSITNVSGSLITIGEVSSVNTINPVTSILSSKLIDFNENLYMELIINCSPDNTNLANFFRIGLTNANLINSNSFNQLIYYGLGKSGGGQVLIRYLNSSVGTNFSRGSSTSSFSTRVTIIKNNNQLIISDSLGQEIFTLPYSTDGYSLSLQMLGVITNECFGVNIITMYKF